MDVTLEIIKSIAEAFENSLTLGEIRKLISSSPLKPFHYDEKDKELCDAKLISQLRSWQNLMDWLQCEDIKLQALEAIKDCLKKCNSPKLGDVAKSRLYDLLSNLPPPVSKRETRKTFYCSTNPPNCLLGLIRFKKLQKLYSFVWLKFAKLKLPDNVFSQMLVFVPDNVMPHVSDPILLTDFFFSSYQLGAPYNILALNGLFVLIVKYNLDYPEFYKQVYGLLQPNIFYLPNREQFFRLLDLFLCSLHVPSYLVAAFVKRLSRLALIAPVDCVLIILTLAKNWLIRHGNLDCLINRNPSEFNSTTDPFIMDEPNPLNSNAIESSLWEIKTLQSHYFPDVVRKAQFVDHSLQTIEDPLLQKTAYKILEKQLNKQIKDYTLAFVPPEGLFRTKDSDLCCFFVD